MDRLTLLLLFLIVPCKIANGSLRILKTEYQPYGRIMCQELCDDSLESFIYTKEDLTCRRQSKGNLKITERPPSEVSTKSIEKEKNSSESSADVRGHLNCDKHYGTVVSDLLQNMTTDANFTEDQKYDRALHQACKEGKLCMVQYILSNGLADINCRGEAWKTPVMVAAIWEQPAVFDFLVSQNCDMMVVTNSNDTLLHLACQGGNTYIVSKLIDSRKYDINRRESSGITPLYVSVLYNHREVLDLLRSKGGDPNTTDNRNNNILHVACYNNNVDLVKHILSLGIVSIDSRGIHGYTPVIMAGRNSNIVVVKLLVSKGCSLTTSDDDGNNILHHACLQGNITFVQFILSLTHNIVSIDSRGQYGYTPVMIAENMGHRKVIQLLLKTGCSLTTADDDGNNILHLACLSGNVTIVEDIISQDKATIDSRGQYGRTPVLVAATSGYKKVVELLVRKGCNLGVSDLNSDNILHIACTKGSYDIVKYVLSQGKGGINGRNLFGRTPLILAAKNGHRKIVELLVRNGCDVKAVDFRGNNILHVAYMGGHVDLVKYLTAQRVVDINAKNKDGKRPVQLAKSQENSTNGTLSKTRK